MRKDEPQNIPGVVYEARTAEPPLWLKEILEKILAHLVSIDVTLAALAEAELTEETEPSEYWVGLSTNPIQADGSGIVEPPVEAGYARVRLPRRGAVTFPKATADWPPLVAWFVADTVQPGTGLIVDFEALPKPLAVHNTEEVCIPLPTDR